MEMHGYIDSMSGITMKEVATVRFRQHLGYL